MVTGQYNDATMKMRVFQKDIDVITNFAEGLACPTPLFSASSEIYAKALADGRDNQDTAAVCAVLEEMAGISPK
jgi:3-hydroxyisobutyrate dehydrogenase-like beta-hydroxyacid dehydrogenase